LLVTAYLWRLEDRLGHPVSPSELVDLAETRGEGDPVELRFHAVRNLVIRQAPDFDARVVRDLEAWIWQDAGDGWGRLEFRFGDLVVAFRARAVELVS
jgi:hypothetical protein